MFPCQSLTHNSSRPFLPVPGITPTNQRTRQQKTTTSKFLATTCWCTHNNNTGILPSCYCKQTSSPFLLAAAATSFSTSKDADDDDDGFDCCCTAEALAVRLNLLPPAFLVVSAFLPEFCLVTAEGFLPACCCCFPPRCISSNLAFRARSYNKIRNVQIISERLSYPSLKIYDGVSFLFLSPFMWLEVVT